MTLEVTTRAATPQDDQFLRRLFESTRPELRILPEPLRGQLLEMQFRARESQYRQVRPNARYLILQVGSEPIGNITFEEGESLHLVDIALLPESRGQGVGGEIIRRLQAQGKRIDLEVSVDNPARRLYERLGFVAADTEGMYVSMTWNPLTSSK